MRRVLSFCSHCSNGTLSNPDLSTQSGGCDVTPNMAALQQQSQLLSAQMTSSAPMSMTAQHQRSSSESEACAEQLTMRSGAWPSAGVASHAAAARLCGSLGASAGREMLYTQHLSQQQPHSLDYNSSASVGAAGEQQLQQQLLQNSIEAMAAVDRCRFPKLEECAHFHYEHVELGGVALTLIEDDTEHGASDDAEPVDGGPWFTISVESGHSCSGPAHLNSSSCSTSVGGGGAAPGGGGGAFPVRRSLENLALLDELLHRCVYDRRVSGLGDLAELRKLQEAGDVGQQEIEDAVGAYLSAFSALADDRITCGPVLTWLRLDNRGRRLLVAQDALGRGINTPAVGAAYGVRRYVAQARDELSFEVGDMISVIDMPSPAESAWWRGKRGFEVGFFPQTCVATIGDKVPRNMPLPAPLVGSLALSPSKPVLRKHGKLIAFFRSFILSRPSRRRLKQSGILKERVFSCDLGEHLLNSGHDIPMVLKCCAEFIEEHGLVDGVYRLSGVTSNIQKLRRAFDEEREPDLTHPDILQDIHSVSSLLKMYFRELPNPLCTYQLYHSFVGAVQARDRGEEGRLRLMREAVQKLPPPHYRTLRYLTRHLGRVAQHGNRTGMTARNIAIVWAPNLLRCARLEGGGVAALQGVGVQAVVTEFLIMNSDLLFCDTPCTPTHSLSSLPPLPCRPKSLAISTPTKLLSLEEARSRHLIGAGGAPFIVPPIPGGYIEVGGGPSSLPDKYHTILPLPRGWHKRASKRSPTGWRALFSRGKNVQGGVAGGAMTGDGLLKTNIDDVTGGSAKEISVLSAIQDRSTGSVESLTDPPTSNHVPGSNNGQPMSRTSGHSRSVSHDSYFDCLQSPGRAGPMGELSELRLNFDLEEPEMRIFSEDESLVSSPKVMRESSRRGQSRARPDESTSVANSSNPSPKKQARTVGSPNGSLRKRYKLEDQLSEIQFIDCATPEHGNTVYTSVQVHQPPKSPSTSASQKPDSMDTTEKQINERISLCDFSRPVSSTKTQKSDRYSCFEPKNTHFDLNTNKVLLKCNSVAGGFCEKNQVSTTNLSDRNTLSGSSLNSQNSASKLSPNYQPLIAESDSENSTVSEEYKMTLNVGPKDEKNEDRSPRTDSLCTLLNVDKKNMSLDLKQSPVSPMTPQISENLKSLNFDDSNATTPNQILDRSLNSETTSQSGSPLDIGYQNLNRLSNISSDSSNDTKIVQTIQIKDMTNAYENMIRKPSVVYENVKPTFINLAPTTSTCKSPIKSTISITYNLKSPVKLKSNLGSPVFQEKRTPETERQEIYESFKHYGNRDRSQSSSGYENVSIDQGLVSYDAGVPTAKADLPCQQARQPDKKADPEKSRSKSLSSKSDLKSGDSSTAQKSYSNRQLLETNLDDVMNEQVIYQSVKIYKNAVSEVNDILSKNDNVFKSTEDMNQSSDQDVSSITYSSENNGPNDAKYKLNIICVGNSCIEDDAVHNSDVSLKSIDSIESSLNPGNSTTFANISNIVTSVNDECSTDLCNIKMDTSEADFDETDSLEIDAVESKQSEIDNYNSESAGRKSSDVAEPMEIEGPMLGECLDRLTDPKNKSDSSKSNVVNKSRDLKLNCDSKPSNFIVKQLATKFELSPVETPVFSFNPGKNINANKNDNRAPKPSVRTKNVKLDKEKAGSLDESAFSREFSCATNNAPISIDSLEETTYPTRRKSFDSSRAKLLNQPKTLPNLQNCSAKDKYNLNLSLSENINEETSKFIPESEKVTPSTENKILLIQHNSHQKSLEQLSTLSGELGSNLESNVSSLEDIRYKLTRERIEKYKQERRTFLRDKYRSESFRNEKDQSLSKFKNKARIDKSNSDSNVTDSLGNVTRSTRSVGENIVPVHTEKIGNKNINTADITREEKSMPKETYSLDRGKKGNRLKSLNNLDLEKNRAEMRKKYDDNNSDVVLRMSEKSGVWERRSLDSPVKQRNLGLDRKSLNERDRASFGQRTADVRDNRIQREKCSPSVCIRDVAAIFESRSSDS